ncbi:MAG TPA: hypothetical protein VLX92_34485 [Kofleriaceae bacterium]|nr:hypothetical protein [Kofleriaceae bacterium]
MSAEPLDISVPCPSCTAAVRFGERGCPSCGHALPASSRKALERRLEAASNQFRALKHNQLVASASVVVIGAGSIALGLVLYWLDTDALGETATALSRARVELGCNLLVGVVMAGCFAWSRRAPTAALSTALVVWLASQASFASLVGVGAFGMISVRVIIIKVVVFALLIRGIVSAVIAARLRARLAPPRPALPGARVVSQR